MQAEPVSNGPVLSKMSGMTFKASPAQAPRLYRDANGREAFHGLIRAWLNRSGWSLRAMAELAEVALRRDLAKDLPDWVEGEYEKGFCVVLGESAWEAMRDTSGHPTAKPSDWAKLTTFKRVHTSQLHKISHGSLTLVSPDIFDALGSLNLYLAALRCLDAELPSSERQAEEAFRGFVLEDADGPLGPEELFSIYLGRMSPPINVTLMSERDATELSKRLARELRSAASATGFDIVEDWAELAAMHPSSDPSRLHKLREITLGLGQWSAEQIEDEKYAVNALIQKLRSGQITPRRD